jgi:hypothetical protein
MTTMRINHNPAAPRRNLQIEARRHAVEARRIRRANIRRLRRMTLIAG